MVGVASTTCYKIHEYSTPHPLHPPNPLVNLYLCKFNTLTNKLLENIHYLVSGYIFCRYVIEPYHKYPNLLDVLFNFLKTEQATGVRREVVRVLGLLGALDPYKHTQHQRNDKRSRMGTPISKPMDKKSQGPGQ